MGSWAFALAIAVLSPSTGYATPTNPPELSGTWAMVQFMPQITDLPLIGETPITAAVGVCVDVEQDGDRVTMRDIYCRTEVITHGTLLTTKVPDKVMASLQPDPRLGRLEAEQDGWRLVSDWHLEVRGALLDHPGTEPLPIGPLDPRVTDLDQDGHPGFTLPVSILGIIEGDTYVVQRLTYRLIGHTVAADRIEGDIEWTSEQIVLDATRAFFLSRFEQWQNPDPSRHRFVMRRLRDDASCQDVIRILDELIAALLEGEGQQDRSEAQDKAAADQ